MLTAFSFIKEKNMSQTHNSHLRKQRSRPLMLSKRACVFYLERVRVILKDDRIVYLTESMQPIEHFYNIPEKNTAFLLLGKGSSITDAAARRLAESNGEIRTRRCTPISDLRRP